MSCPVGPPFRLLLPLDRTLRRALQYALHELTTLEADHFLSLFSFLPT